MNTTEIILLTIAIVSLIICVTLNKRLTKAKKLSDTLAGDTIKVDVANMKLTKENKTLIERQASMQKAFVTAEADLKHKITFNLPPKGELAINVKVKTIVNKETGITTLYPTIRRKVDGIWKEIPVDIKYTI